MSAWFQIIIVACIIQCSNLKPWKNNFHGSIMFFFFLHSNTFRLVEKKSYKKIKLTGRFIYACADHIWHPCGHGPQSGPNQGPFTATRPKPNAWKAHGGQYCNMQNVTPPPYNLELGFNGRPSSHFSDPKVWSFAPRFHCLCLLCQCWVCSYTLLCV